MIAILQVLTCGIIKTNSYEYISHAKTCINPMKSNDLNTILIKPDQSMKQMAIMLQSMPVIHPQTLDTLNSEFSWCK